MTPQGCFSVFSDGHDFFPEFTEYPILCPGFMESPALYPKFEDH